MIENPTRLLTMRTMWGLFFAKCPQSVLKIKEKTEISVFFWCGRWDLNKSTHDIIGSICLILPS